jgi:hypothetical protein
VFGGRKYEVATGQQGSGVAHPVGKAQGHSCGSKGDMRVAAYTVNEQPPEEALAASYGNRVIVYWPAPSAELVPVPYPAIVRQSGGATAADLALVRAFAQFAVRPTPGYRDAVGFAERGPRIGLGPALRRAPIDDLAAESAWTFPARGFAGAAGPINILDVLRDHLMDALFARFTGPSEAVTDLLASSGEHRRCVGPPLPVSPELVHLRQLSIQPDPGHTRVVPGLVRRRPLPEPIRTRGSCQPRSARAVDNPSAHAAFRASEQRAEIGMASSCAASR